MNSQVAAWVTGIGAVLAAIAGVALVVREIRRKERQDAMRTVEQLDRIIVAQQQDAISCHGYVYTLRVLCADKGIDTPTPPPLVEVDVGTDSLLPGVGRTGHRHRWIRRRRRSEQRDPDDGDSDGATGATGTTGTPW